MDEIPHEFEGWKLMDAKSLFGFWSEVGTITVGDDEWVMGRGEASLEIFLSTTLPHPDDPEQTARYVRNVADDFRSLADRLTTAT